MNLSAKNMRAFSALLVNLRLLGSVTKSFWVNPDSSCRKTEEGVPQAGVGVRIQVTG